MNRPESDKENQSRQRDGNNNDSPGSVNPDYKVRKRDEKTVDHFVEAILDGNRPSLSQAITLLESRKELHRAKGEQILEKCLPHTGDSIRIGITGVPGVGKSTFIESMGSILLEKEMKPAVLAIDPSSSRTGGSILADKTRMRTLSSHPKAYVRPSPTSGSLGGVARTTRETLLLCEAAGFNVIFVETVGVGQSETLVHSMVDLFLLLLIPGAGDELQGIKRGIVEMADMVAINKAEKANRTDAERAKRDYENALSLFPPQPSGWVPPVMLCSALENEGVEKIWEKARSYIDQSRAGGWFSKRREEQAIDWMNEVIERELQDRFQQHEKVKKQLPVLKDQVRKGETSPFSAADQLLEIFNK